MEQQLSLKVDQYIYLKKTASTNQYVQDVVSKSFPHRNYCIYTDNQTVGRGQIDRYWFSDIGKNLTVSYLYQLSVAVQDQFDISIALSLAVHDFCKELVAEPVLAIKWPNDIYYKNGKLAGLLIQNNIRGKQIVNTTLGIGLNVNQKLFPKHIPNPISLSQITGKDYEIIPLLFELEKHIGYRLAFLEKNKDRCRKEYFSRLFKRNTLATYKRLDNNTIFKAKIQSITKEGKLVLDTGNQKEVFNFREVQLIK